jgi:hypothetical protein
MPGCGENFGSGWVAVPCTCELWLENTTPAPIAASIEITVVPDQPSPAQAHGADIAFEDPDASWYGVWKAQSAGGGFSVTNESGKTTVTVTQSVTLKPVPLPACVKRVAQTQLNDATTVSMHALRDDGSTLATMALCASPGPS